MALFWWQCIHQSLKWGLLFDKIFFLTLLLLINSIQVHADSFFEYFASEQKLNSSHLRINNKTKVSNFYNLDLIISSTPSIKFYSEIIEKENLPIDLALIPLLESGNNPLARSKKNALGLWQFLPSTAREWGLSTNRIDSRTNVIESTQAAIQYLSYLHGQFKNWDLALAAYNWGIGSVKKALKTGLITNNKINLHKLPLETRKYLLSFHHLNSLIKNNYNNPKLSRFPNTKYLVRIKKINISNYISSNKLKNINGSVLMHINGYDVLKMNTNKEILIPSLEFQEYFSTQKISYKKNSNITSCPKKYHKVKYRDTLKKLAREYKITIDSLKQLNPQISFLRPGMNIKLCVTN